MLLIIAVTMVAPFKTEDSRNEPDNEDLLIEFRILTMLLALVTAMNNKGQSMVDWHKKKKADKREAVDNRVPQAIACLLVRDFEVVAAMSQPTLPQAISILSVDDPEHFGDDEDMTEHVEVTMGRGFATVANPDHRDHARYFGDEKGKKSIVIPKKQKVLLAPAGTSRWDTISMLGVLEIIDNIK
jgi:hypothetical protein